MNSIDKKSLLSSLTVVLRVSLCAGLIVGFLFALSGTILYFTFPKMMREQLNEDFSFDQTLETKNGFSTPTEFSYVYVRLFNVTNPDKVNSGQERVKLNEVGPFVYKLMKKLIITENDPKEVSFEEIPSFVFEPSLSIGDPQEFNIYHVNAPDTANEYFLDDLSSKYAIFFSGGFKTGQYVVKNTASEMLTEGYDVQLYDSPRGHSGLVIMMADKPTRKSGYIYQNNLANRKIKIETNGDIQDIDRLTNKITYCNWRTIPCCTEQQSCSSTNFPNVRRNTVSVFNSELCREVKLNYLEKLDVDDIQVLRYSTANETSESHSYQNENHGDFRFSSCNSATDLVNHLFYSPFTSYEPTLWKLEHGQRLARGKLCRFNSVDLKQSQSPPHFYGTDGWTDFLEGLSPNIQKHPSRIDVEPITGLVLRSELNTQINVPIKKRGSKLFKNGKEFRFPLYWIGEERQLESDVLKELRWRVTYRLKYGTGGIIVLMACGASLVLFSIFVLAFQEIRKKMTIKRERERPTSV